MKRLRIIAFMLVFTLLLSAEIPVSAAEEAVTLLVSPAEIQSYATEITIRLETEEEVYGGSFVVAYDPAVIRYDYESTNGSILCQINTEYAQGKIKVSFASSSPISDSDLLGLYFSANTDDATSTEIRLEDVSLYDENTRPLTVKPQSAVCDVKPAVPISSVELVQKELSLGIGESFPLNLRLTPSNAQISSVNWYTENNYILSVDSNGKITGNAEGSTCVCCEIWDCNGNYFYQQCLVWVYRKPTLTVDSLQVTKGQTVTLPIRLNTMDNDFYSGSLNLTYDPAALKLISVEAGSLLQGTLTTINPAYSENAARINFAGQLPVTGSGILGYATFEVLGDGSTEITPQNVELFLEDGTTYAPSIGKGVVTVGTGTLSLSDVDELAKRGFGVTLSYDGNMSIAGGSFCITYDPTKLTLGEVIPKDDSLLMQVNPSYKENQIRISFAGTADFSSAELARITFISLENEASESSLSLDSVNLYNQTGKTVYADTKDATVTIAYNDVTATKGDLSDDGTVNTWDATLLARYLKGDETTAFIYEAADINADGWVNRDDMILLMRLLAEWETVAE